MKTNITMVVYGYTTLGWLENQLESQNLPYFIKLGEDLHVVKIETGINSNYIDSLRIIVDLRNDSYLKTEHLNSEYILEDYKEMLK